MKEKHEWIIPIQCRELKHSSGRMEEISRSVDEEYPAIPEEIFQEWKRIAKRNYLPVRVSRTRFVMRHTEECSPFGPWRVVMFSYQGKKHTSLLDDIYGYAKVKSAHTIQEGNNHE